MSKPNGYGCDHHRTIPGNAHLRCGHPVLSDGNEVLAMAVVQMTGRFEPFDVVGDSTGLRRGWFAWPLNFDPIWLQSCNQFKSTTDNNPTARGEVIPHETKQEP